MAPSLPVTPARKAVLGVMARPDIASLSFHPDLALCTNASRNTVTGLRALARGVNVRILSAPTSQHEELLVPGIIKMRLLGPNGLGLLAPWQGAECQLFSIPIKQGKLAFISQSAAVSNTILDWAQQREMGFSYFYRAGR